jgi:copper homeostasis protein
MNTVLLELCAESFQAALAGETGGADRIELCSALALGGVTPGAELMDTAIRSLTIPIHVLIRPREGNFEYSASEFDLMQRQVEQAKSAGARGVALGVLLPGGRVDVERSRKLTELARPMSVTFHRAFDETRNLSESLESVIETGADNLLTSGGAPDVLSGVEMIAKLFHQAGKRIQVIAGGGLRLENVVEIVRRSRVMSLHGSFSRKNGHKSPNGTLGSLEADVRQAVALLRREHFEQAATLSKT